MQQVSKVARKKSPKVLVALSGGVDSAVAAALLKEQGYAVTGAHMVCWDEGPYCTAEEDRASAIKVASHLQIPLKIFDFRKEYKKAVVDYFVSEYKEGLTPNPDIACNKEIKFGIFFDKAKELGYDYIATGHYVRLEKSKTGEKELLSGLDPNKDQSYFLYMLQQRHLNHSIFPIGHLTKEEVRRIARNLNLPNAERKDSQGICFIGEVSIKEFLKERMKYRFGEVVNLKGKVLGKHEGLAFYTIGQREGLSISEKIPHYVVSKQKKTNRLIVAPLGDKQAFSTEIFVKKLSWVGNKPKKDEMIQARIRYRQPLFKAKISRLSDKLLTLTCLEPQRAVTPGQAAVLYSNGSKVLGGGLIY